MEAEIKLIGPEITGKAGETVRLSAEFDRPCESSIHERRESSGYIRISDQKGSDKHVFDATIHNDTTHFIFSIGDNGSPDLAMTNNIGQLWCPVTVSDVTPEPVDLGKYLYKVGILPDTHLCVDNDSNTSSMSDDWWDEGDFRAAMDILKDDSDVKFVCSCGDLIESGSPRKATPEADSNDFRNIYDIPYWQVAGLRFFSPLGNHDFYGIFESRKGDTITGAKNSETTFGYNVSISNRISNIWLTDSGINGIVPGRGRIVFELENGKHTPQGQADMNFFAYNAYVDLYAKSAGYTASVWDSNKGGISDEAIKVTKNYVNNNWMTCKDSLSGWKDSGLHGRNVYSKLSYWLKKDNDIFIFLSVDYGDDVWPVNDSWHDRMIHARTIINLNTEDPYIKRMKEYVSDTGYSSTDEPYNYQYYSPNSLIWLKEILENNTDKKIYIFTHHFLPNKVGCSNGIPKDGAWSYADIHPAGELTSEGINKGSNTLTGIEFWFLNKLNNLYKNVVWFSGHSHISWEVDCHCDNHDYDIVSPSAKNSYVYTKASDTPKAESAWTVSLPSVSKPRNIVNNQSVRLYNDAEMAIMEVYEKGIKLKGYKIREDNKYVNKLLAEQEIQLISRKATCVIRK